jgi:hypothetical protein
MDNIINILNAVNALWQTLISAPMHTIIIIVVVFVTGAGLFFLYGVAKRRGWIGEISAVTDAIRSMSSQFVSAVGSLQAAVVDLHESTEKIARGQDTLAKTMERGYLSSEHTEIVRDFAFGRDRDLRSALIEDLMTIYETYVDPATGKWCGDEVEVTTIINKKIESEIIRIDGRINRLPSVAKHSPTSQEKQAHLYSLTEHMYRLLSTERRKSEVRRIISEMLTEVIITKRF